MRLWGIGTILVVACLVADMATPLCPGAFRFDHAQSIEVVGARAIVALPPHISAAPLQGHDAGRVWRSDGRRTREPVVRMPARWVLPRAALASGHLDAGSPRRSEDG